MSKANQIESRCTFSNFDDDNSTIMTEAYHDDMQHLSLHLQTPSTTVSENPSVISEENDDFAMMSEDDHNLPPIPVIFVQNPKVYLTRWDAGDNTGCPSACLSPKSPSRPYPPRRKLKIKNPGKKQMLASMSTGITLGDISLKPVEFSDNGSVRSADLCTPLSNVLRLKGPNTKHEVTAVFCIRRAGCGMCRLHGLQLSELASEINFRLVGVIKETGVADELLSDFYMKYFNFPCYKDENLDMFKFLGDRKVSVWKLLKAAPKVAKIYSKQNIENVPLGGDIFTKGGILLFDKNSKLRYVYYERYGDKLDLDALRLAIKECQQEVMDVAPTAVRRRSVFPSAPRSPQRLPSTDAAPTPPPRRSFSPHGPRLTQTGLRTDVAPTVVRRRSPSPDDTPRLPTRRTSIEVNPTSIRCRSPRAEKPLLPQRLTDNSTSEQTEHPLRKKIKTGYMTLARLPRARRRDTCKDAILVRQNDTLPKMPRSKDR